LVKTGFGNNQNDLGMKILELEKLFFQRIPQYLRHNKWDKALKLSYEIYDADIISSSLNKNSDYIRVGKDFLDIIKIVPNIRHNVFDLKKKLVFI
jgi:hypothetical protein